MAKAFTRAALSKTERGTVHIHKRMTQSEPREYCVVQRLPVAVYVPEQTTMRREFVAENDDAQIITEAATLLCAFKDDAACHALRRLSISDPLPPLSVQDVYQRDRPLELPRRPKMPIARLARILSRDKWHCHYCGRRLVLAPVIATVGYFCPIEFPFPSHAMPEDRTHPAAVRVYPNVDHIIAGAIGGDWTDDANLVAACTPCNTRKNDRVGWVQGSFERKEWDGISSLYSTLYSRLPVERRTAAQTEWLKAVRAL